MRSFKIVNELSSREKKLLQGKRQIYLSEVVGYIWADAIDRQADVVNIQKFPTDIILDRQLWVRNDIVLSPMNENCDNVFKITWVSINSCHPETAYDLTIQCHHPRLMTATTAINLNARKRTPGSQKSRPCATAKVA